VLLVKVARDTPWPKDRRLVAVGGGCLVAGFLLGLVIFGAPWHLPPDWGDIPTWLLVGAGIIGGWAALRQLSLLQEQLKEDAQRNDQRDKMLQIQIEDVMAKARSDRRRQAEGIELRAYGHDKESYGLVLNNSRRPITDLTCKLVERPTGETICRADRCGAVTTVEQADASYPVTRPRLTWNGERPGSRYPTLLPASKCRFAFELTLDRLELPGDDPLLFLVVWFTDDEGFRWHLDQFQHLAETEGEEYKL
jgi:hypothetical protein